MADDIIAISWDKPQRPKETSKGDIGIPTFAKWTIVFIVIGTMFPIYGSPPGFLGIPRLTFFRLGLIMAIFSAYAYRVPLIPIFTQWPEVILLTILLIIKCLSLIITPSWLVPDGATQIWWYVQGLLCLILMLAFFRRWPKVRPFLFSCIIFWGTAAALLTGLQYLLLRSSGIIWALPLSQSPVGILSGPYEGWYPFAPGGRALGPFADPNMTGSIMVFVSCLALPSISLNLRKNGIKSLIVLIAALLALIGSGSRQAMVIVAIAMFIYSMIIISRKHISLRCFYIFLIIIVAFVSVRYSYSLLSSIDVTEILQDQYQGDTISRLAYGIHDSKELLMRLHYSSELLNSLDFRTLLLGCGEGAGLWAAHNAYLLILQENGLWASVVLFVAGCLMLLRAYKDASKSIRLKQQDSLTMAGPLIVMSWMLMLAMNWAQLNQSFSWIFLPLVLMRLRKVELPSLLKKSPVGETNL